MELFISSDQPKDTLSTALELFAIYVRAIHRDVIKLNVLSIDALNALKFPSVGDRYLQTSDNRRV
jgi:hypothetical protein